MKLVEMGGDCYENEKMGMRVMALFRVKVKEGKRVRGKDGEKRIEWGGTWKNEVCWLLFSL